MKILITLMMCSLPLVGSAETGARRLNVAVVQFESIDGDVPRNLRTAEGWVNQAVSAGAELILFPEFMSTGYHLSEAIWESSETMKGPTVRWLMRRSAENHVWLGTTFLEVEGEHFYDTFVLTNAKGQVAGKVRKEVPASAEGYFIKGEVNNHVIETELGRIGIMICYENYLTRIANKVAGAEVDLLLSPFSFPELRGGSGAQPLPGSEYASFYGETLGIPVAVANKTGRWRSPVPGYPGYMADGEFPGLSAIARADGSVAAKADRKPGFVVATVDLDPAVKKINVAYAGKFVTGLIGGTVATDPGSPEVADQGAANYMNSEQRKAKALRNSH